MPNVLRIMLQFLHPDPAFHGQRDGGEPEWPPSPLRMLQALVAASADRWREPQFSGYAKPVLEWLERLPAPVIIAPGHQIGTPFRIAVPNNDLDVWARPTSRGSEPKKQPNELKTMKQVRPTHLSGEVVHYLYTLPAGGCPHAEVLKAAARSVTHLGWGVDMVAADAGLLDEKQVADLTGEVWRPSGNDAGTPLRVPVEGTLVGLMDKHEKFLNRLSADGFKPVPPLSAFAVRHYRRATDAVPPAWCAFTILKPDASGNAVFATTRRARDVAAWARHATAAVCREWDDVASFVHGHDPNDSQKPARGEAAGRRFQYLPLPSIERHGDRGERVGTVRRVLIAAPPDCRDRIDFIRRRLAGQELLEETPDGPRPCGLLNILPSSDWVLKQYVDAARVWSTVTPVVWPGHDDHDPAKAEKLLRKAFLDAGLSREVMAAIGPADVEWRAVGFRAGVDLARNYRRPNHLTGRAYHVRVRFAHPVRGPLAVGAGRYRGLGVFAGEGER